MFYKIIDFLLKRKDAKGWLVYAKKCRKCGRVYPIEREKNICFCGGKLVKKFVDCDKYENV